MPREITIKGGEEARLDLGVIRGAAISGTVLIYGTKDTVLADTSRAPLVELGGHPNVVLELANPVESHRRISDNRGRFSFTGIRPGRWTLEVVDGNLPTNAYFEKDKFELELKPGGAQQVELKVLPRKRRIQIVQAGKVLEETKPGERKKPVPPPVKPQPERVVAAKPRPPAVQPAPVKAVDTTYIIVRLPRGLGYSIQTSSWSTERGASREAARILRAFGYYTYVKKVVLPERGTWYRVYVGIFALREAAEKAAQEIRK
jgi:cell division septation protein DedD